MGHCGRAVIVAAALAAGAWVQRPATLSLTSLTLRAHGPAGEPVRITAARLLFDWWGGGQIVDLEPDGRGVAVDLDPAWVTARWPTDWWSMVGVRLYIEADGYAPRLSDTFQWIGTLGRGGTAIDATTISFIDQTVTVGQYDRRTFDLAMRRPESRRIRLVDQTGRPAAGVTVNIYMYWTRQNHCGVFEGRPLINGGVTDGEGRLRISDGDFEFGVDLPNGADPVVFDGEAVFYQRVIALTGTETDVPVHRFRPRTITVQVAEANGAAARVKLVAFDRYTGCMDPGIRPLGASDASGRATIVSFDPDRYNDVVACREEREVWRDRAAVLAGENARIVIPAQLTPPRLPRINPCARRSP